MNVFSNSVVTITFKLYDASNTLLEEAAEALSYLHGGHSGIFPKIEEALNFKKVCESVSVTLEPADAFGDYDPALMRVEPVEQLPPDVTVGGYLVAETSNIVAPAYAPVDATDRLSSRPNLFVRPP